MTASARITAPIALQFIGYPRHARVFFFAGGRPASLQGDTTEIRRFIDAATILIPRHQRIRTQRPRAGGLSTLHVSPGYLLGSRAFFYPVHHSGQPIGGIAARSAIT